MDLPAVLTGLAGPLDGLDEVFIVRRRQIIRHERPVGEMWATVSSLANYLEVGRRSAVGSYQGYYSLHGSNDHQQPVAITRQSRDLPPQNTFWGAGAGAEEAESLGSWKSGHGH